MEYTYYGNSGLRISKLGLGLMKISNTDLENATKIFEHAYKSGINYFDTGEFYGEGKSEIMLGQIIKKLNIPREKLVILNYGILVKGQMIECLVGKESLKQ